MNGGAGDDTLVWNNGDGNDEMNGDAGLDRIENNLGAGDDVSQLKVEQRQRPLRPHQRAVQRSTSRPSEVFELNTFGGNDTLDVAPGVGALIAIQADAGSGDDRLDRRRRGRHVLRRPRQRHARLRAPAATPSTARTATTRC